jgi:hypothetical protein
MTRPEMESYLGDARDGHGPLPRRPPTRPRWSRSNYPWPAAGSSTAFDLFFSSSGSVQGMVNYVLGSPVVPRRLQQRYIKKQDQGTDLAAAAWTEERRSLRVVGTSTRRIMASVLFGRPCSWPRSTWRVSTCSE